MPDVYVELPVDPSDEELARDWTLSAADLEEVRKGCGPEHRQRFAVQLCALRALVDVGGDRHARGPGRPGGRQPGEDLELADVHQVGEATSSSPSARVSLWLEHLEEALPRQLLADRQPRDLTCATIELAT